MSQQGYAVPVTTTGFLPGDSLTRAVNLVNDGNSALGSVTLSSSAHPVSSVLTTDVSNGLQLTVKKCLGRVDPGRHRPGPHLRLLRHRDRPRLRPGGHQPHPERRGPR